MLNLADEIIGLEKKISEYGGVKCTGLDKMDPIIRFDKPNSSKSE